MWVEVALGLAGLFAALYLYMTRNYGFFKARGVKHVKPVFPWGSPMTKEVTLGKTKWTFRCNVH